MLYYILFLARNTAQSIEVREMEIVKKLYRSGNESKRNPQLSFGYSLANYMTFQASNFLLALSFFRTFSTKMYTHKQTISQFINSIEAK